MTIPRELAVLYPILIAFAILVAYRMFRRSDTTPKLSPQNRTGVALGAFCGGMIGAKLPFALSDMPGLLDGTVWISDGKTILCGLVGAYFGVEFAKWVMGVQTRTGDSLIAPAAVAIAIGRLGCFVAGCCYGTETTMPWGMRFPASETPALLRHPTQLYEAIFHASMAALLIWLREHQIWRGQLAKFYILTYLGYRLLSEFIRPEPRFIGGLTAYQWFSLALIPLFAFLWWRDSRLLKRELMCQERLPA